MHPNHIRLVAIDPLDAKILFERGQAALVDVRDEDEWRSERISGAILNPLSRFEVSDMPVGPESRVILYCHGGARSPKAADLLFHAGYVDLMLLRGGLTGWKQAGLPTDSGAGLRDLEAGRAEVRRSDGNDFGLRKLRRA